MQSVGVENKYVKIFLGKEEFAREMTRKNTKN
jgi:hypothetical protein